VTVVSKEPALPRVAQLPSAAVGPDQTVLLIGEEDRLELANVEVLRRQGDDVIVRAPGLRGREVVSERSQVLGVGIKVKPVRPDAPAPQEPELVERPDHCIRGGQQPDPRRGKDPYAWPAARGQGARADGGAHRIADGELGSCGTRSDPPPAG